LMQSGKSTLFSAISGKQMLPAGTTTIEPAVVAFDCYGNTVYK
jgi:ABC-type uncharacterized transport system ATPase component